MSRTRMSWDWAGDYPIFVYTTWLDHNQFHVKIVKGVKNNQNAGGTGPRAPAWIEYTREGIASKQGVVIEALKLAEARIKKELGNNG